MFISIIVTIFRVEKYIEKCLESIIDAGVEDCEILLIVRDGDTSCIDICNRYAVAYESIKIIIQPGIGLSDAKNTGIKQSKGNYLVFIDGDDFVKPDEFRHAIDELRTVQADIDVVIFDFWGVDDRGNVVYERNQTDGLEGKIIESKDVSQYINGKYSVWNTWRYIYSANYMRNIQDLFEYGMLCEDVLFTVSMFLSAKRFYVSKFKYYCYCGYREDSLFNNGNSKYNRDLIRVITKSLTMLDKSVYLKDLRNHLIREFVLSMATIPSVSEDRTQILQLYEDNLNLMKKSGFKYKLCYLCVRLLGVQRCSNILYKLKLLRRKKRISGV